MVTADTTVMLNGEVLGKLRNPAHAWQLLLSLRDRWHAVVTGVAVSKRVNREIQLRSASRSTLVLMRPYSAEEIAAYIATGDPMDKAGVYAIQYASFQPTACIADCYLNVVGLPLYTLLDLLAEFDVQPAAVGRQQAGCPWSEHCQLSQEESAWTA